MRKFVLRFVSLVAPLLVTSLAFAQEGAATNENDIKMAGMLAGALGLGIAAAGGAVGQGRAVAAALEGIARNPGASGKLFLPMIIGLALIESLVIYSLLIAFNVTGG